MSLPTFSRRRFVALSIGAALVPRAVKGQALATLRAASSPNDDVTSLLVAQQRGLFKREGLDVTVQSINSGAAVAAAVAGGSLDIGKSSVMSLISAHLRGIPFVIVAAAGIYDSTDPVVSLLVRANDPARVPKDLNGRTIGVPALGDLYSVADNAFVQSAGGDPGTLKFVEISSAASTEALIRGRIDAVNLTTPALVIATESGKLRVLGHPFDAIAKRFMQAAWFTTRDFAAKNRDTIARFNRALREAAAYANAHHAETAPILAAFTHTDAALINRMPRTASGTTLEPALLQPVIDAAVRYKAIPSTFDARAMLDAASIG